MGKTTVNKATPARLHILAARQVLEAKPGDHRDGGGLVLRIRAERQTSAGVLLAPTEVWIFRFTSPNGRRREMGLGAVERASLAQAGASLVLARDLAHEARDLLRRGVDPLDARAHQREEAREAEAAKKADRARQQLTLARAARDYHERVIEPTRTPRHAAQWISSLENHIPPALWRAPVDTITAPALLAALEGIKPHARARNLTTAGGKLPETVRRIRQRLEAVFEDLSFRGQVSANPAAAIRRKLRETEPGKKAKVRNADGFRALPYKDAPALMARLRAMPGTAARCLELAVLTAARTSEVLLAEWPEFDLSAGVWVCPAARMKGGEPHTVPLSPAALQVLAVQAGQDARLVFPSPTTADSGAGRPLSNMAMLSVLDRLGVRGQTTVHGLARATFSTWANETAAARPDVIEAALAHREADRIRRAYSRAAFHAERQALLLKWSEYLAGGQIIQSKGDTA